MDRERPNRRIATPSNFRYLPRNYNTNTNTVGLQRKIAVSEESSENEHDQTIDLLDLKSFDEGVKAALVYTHSSDEDYEDISDDSVFTSSSEDEESSGSFESEECTAIEKMRFSDSVFEFLDFATAKNSRLADDLEFGSPIMESTKIRKSSIYEELTIISSSCEDIDSPSPKKIDETYVYFPELPTDGNDEVQAELGEVFIFDDTIVDIPLPAAENAIPQSSRNISRMLFSPAFISDDSCDDEKCSAEVAVCNSTITQNSDPESEHAVSEIVGAYNGTNVHTPSPATEHAISEIVGAYNGTNVHTPSPGTEQAISRIVGAYNGTNVHTPSPAREHAVSEKLNLDGLSMVSVVPNVPSQQSDRVLKNFGKTKRANLNEAVQVHSENAKRLSKKIRNVAAARKKGNLKGKQPLKQNPAKKAFNAKLKSEKVFQFSSFSSSSEDAFKNTKRKQNYRNSLKTVSKCPLGRRRTPLVEIEYRSTNLVKHRNDKGLEGIPICPLAFR